MNIIKNIVPKDKYSIKCPFAMKPSRIVVHNTANDASARDEISYMISNNEERSFHYAVDDKEIVQGIEENRNAWHASDENGKGNREGIAIEICYSRSGGDKFIKAEENAIELILDILKRYGWTIDKVTKHQDYTSKYCPHRTLDLGWQRFLNKIQKKIEENTDNLVNVYYKVRTKKHGWLAEVKNLEDYAGYENSPITDVAIKVNKGTIRYRVHLKNGNWLPYVSGYDISNFANGYAGNGKEIDAIEVYYNTPSNIRPYKKAKYRVNDYPYQLDDERNENMAGYAGIFGKNVYKFQIIIE